MVFTWGDNRYGQLGRVACFTEEEGRPYPVLATLGEEVTQVAAGKHHCLALSAEGCVWSWGRNKVGQLGLGDDRDRVAPQQVRHESSVEGRDGNLLGSMRGEGITRISAGGHSSVACTRDASIWQWGEISGAFVKNCSRPHCVFTRESYRTRMRKGKTCIAETACQVLLAKEELDRIKELIVAVRQLRESIAERRLALTRMESEKKKSKEQGEQGGGRSEAEDMSDTLAVLEQEISATESEIQLYKKNMESCEQQQAHQREQLQQISEKGLELNDREDQVSLDLIDARKGTTDWKDLSERLQEVKEYIQANNNARMTILDQRSQMDKEKQRLSRSLDERVRAKLALVQRYNTVKELSQAAIVARDTSDQMIKFLSEHFKEVFDHFEGKHKEEEFVAAMQDSEGDQVFLNHMEAKVKIFVDVSHNQAEGIRAEKGGRMLQELMDMARMLNDFNTFSWTRDDVDLSSFFKKARRPPPPEEFGTREQRTALPPPEARRALTWLPAEDGAR